MKVERVNSRISVIYKKHVIIEENNFNVMLEVV